MTKKVFDKNKSSTIVHLPRNKILPNGVDMRDCFSLNFYYTENVSEPSFLSNYNKYQINKTTGLCSDSFTCSLARMFRYFLFYRIYKVKLKKHFLKAQLPVSFYLSFDLLNIIWKEEYSNLSSNSSKQISLSLFNEVNKYKTYQSIA